MLASRRSRRARALTIAIVDGESDIKRKAWGKGILVKKITLGKLQLGS